MKLIIGIVVVPLALLFVFGIFTPGGYAPAYNAMSHEIQAREQSRATPKDVQMVAVQKKMDECFYGRNGALSSETYAREKVASRLLPDEVKAGADHVEQVCTTALLDNVAVGNPKGARALAALFAAHHYALSDDYRATAQRDDTALASVAL